MSNLEKLVPPLELCKLIPEGEFKETVFIWMEVEASATMEKTWSLMEGTPYARNRTNRQIPAPTLEEILAKIPFAQVSIFADKSFVIHPRFGKERHMRYHDNNAATAAMKLYLKLKGIEAQLNAPAESYGKDE